MDPFDYNVLGLYCNGMYLDTCIPFGMRHGSPFFQRVGDVVCHVMGHQGYDIINYIDDFLGYGMPDIAKKLFDALRNIMED